MNLYHPSRSRHCCPSMCKKPPKPKRTLYFSGNFTHAHYSWWVTMETMMETSHARMQPAFSTRDACSHPTMKRQNGDLQQRATWTNPTLLLQRSQPRQWRTGFLIRTRGNYTRGDQLLFSGTFYRTEFGKYGGMGKWGLKCHKGDVLSRLIESVGCRTGIAFILIPLWIQINWEMV